MCRTKVLLTGGCGFAGAHILAHLLQNTDWEIILLDRISYAGSLERINEYARNERVRFVFHDFRAVFPASVLRALDGVDFVIHNGGETHVERSLHDAQPFMESNVIGTMNVFNACRLLGVKQVIYVSTDEVLGPAPDDVDHVETDPYNPSNPYSASKAAGEMIAKAWYKAFKFPVAISRTMNLFGERQHPEKFIPMTIRKVIARERVTIHGASTGLIGSRKWLHARNQADALMFLLKICDALDISGETYHVAGVEKNNLEIAQFIADVIEADLNYDIVDFHSQRPGHDIRYSLSDRKIRSLGWRPPVSFEESLARTIRWTIRPENHRWLEDEISIKESNLGYVSATA